MLALLTMFGTRILLPLASWSEGQWNGSGRERAHIMFRAAGRTEDIGASLATWLPGTNSLGFAFYGLISTWSIYGDPMKTPAKAYQAKRPLYLGDLIRHPFL